MDSVNIGGTAVVQGIDGVIDSGTTLIAGDSASVATFYQGIPGSQDATQFDARLKGFYTGGFLRGLHLPVTFVRLILINTFFLYYFYNSALQQRPQRLFHLRRPDLQR